MKLILTKNIKDVGKEGDLVEVADGFARNFLLPRKFAIEANKGNLNKLEELRRHQLHRREKNLQENKLLAEKLGKNPVTLSAKIGKEGKLFGSITSADIAKAIKAKIGSTLDKRRIELIEPIRQAGTYAVPIKLDDVEATVKVEVIGA